MDELDSSSPPAFSPEVYEPGDQQANPSGLGDVATLSTRHEAVMLVMLENPTMPLKELAEKTGYTYTYLTTLIRSDLFRERLRRLQEHFSAADIRVVKHKLRSVATRALGHLEARLDVPSELVDPDFALRVAREAVAGISRIEAPAGAYARTNINLGSQTLVVASKEDLAEARAILGGTAGPEDSEAFSSKALSPGD